MGGNQTGSVPETVYVLKYDHKHGDDLSVYLSEEDAEIGAAHLMLEWISYLCDGEDLASAQGILDYIEKGEYAEAMRKWPVLAGDTEYITIETVKVYPDPPEVDADTIQSVRQDITPEPEGGAEEDS